MKKGLFFLLFVPFVLFSQHQGVPALLFGAETQSNGDIFPQDNAASAADVNSVGTVWTNGGTGASITSVFVSGRGYVIQIEATAASGGFDGAFIEFACTNGITYDYSIDYRVLVDNTSSIKKISDWDGLVTSPDVILNDDGNWHTISGSSDSNDILIQIEGWVARFSQNGLGDIIQVDNVSMIPQ